MSQINVRISRTGQTTIDMLNAQGMQCSTLTKVLEQAAWRDRGTRRSLNSSRQVRRSMTPFSIKITPALKALKLVDHGKTLLTICTVHLGMMCTEDCIQTGSDGRGHNDYHRQPRIWSPCATRQPKGRTIRHAMCHVTHPLRLRPSSSR